MINVQQIPVLDDNYIFLIHESESGKTAVIDPAVAAPVQKILNKKGWTLDLILNTHHHWDHIGGNEELKKLSECRIIASEYDKKRIPGVDQPVSSGDILPFGASEIVVLDTPGHTLGHIVYFIPAQNLLFCGDTLFSLGCGRLFEGSPRQMWQSLQKIKALPDDTLIYCAHEYTLNNARFALSVDAENSTLQAYFKKIVSLSENHQATIPSSLKIEKACNPFLRTDSPSIQKNLNMDGYSEEEVFARLRHLKDNF